MKRTLLQFKCLLICLSFFLPKFSFALPLSYFFSISQGISGLKTEKVILKIKIRFEGTSIEQMKETFQTELVKTIPPKIPYLQSITFSYLPGKLDIFVEFFTKHKEDGLRIEIEMQRLLNRLRKNWHDDVKPPLVYLLDAQAKVPAPMEEKGPEIFLQLDRKKASKWQLNLAEISKVIKKEMAKTSSVPMDFKKMELLVIKRFNGREIYLKDVSIMEKRMTTKRLVEKIEF